MTLRGAEYLTYDLAQRGVDPILSVEDEISLYFRTRKSNGLLFYTGEEDCNYMDSFFHRPVRTYIVSTCLIIVTPCSVTVYSSPPRERARLPDAVAARRRGGPLCGAGAGQAGRGGQAAVGQVRRQRLAPRGRQEAGVGGGCCCCPLSLADSWRVCLLRTST